MLSVFSTVGWVSGRKVFLLLLLLQISWIRVLPSHSRGGTLQKSRFKTVAQLNADVC